MWIVYGDFLKLLKECRDIAEKEIQKISVEDLKIALYYIKLQTNLEEMENIFTSLMWKSVSFFYRNNIINENLQNI